jgi:hypothetical protein
MLEQRERSDRLSAIDFRTNMFQAFSVLDQDASNAVYVSQLRQLLEEMRSRYLDTSRLILWTPLIGLLKTLLNCATRSRTFSETQGKLTEPIMPQNTAPSSNARFNITTGQPVLRNSTIRFGSRMSRYSTALMSTIILHDVTFSDAEMDILLLNLLRPISNGPWESNCNEILDSEKVSLTLFYDFPAKCLSQEALRLVKESRKQFLNRGLPTESGAKDTLPTWVVLSLKYVDSKPFDACADSIFFVCSIVYLGGVQNFSLHVFVTCFALVETVLRFVSKGRKRYVFCDNSRR